jgi:hypothetical protein
MVHISKLNDEERRYLESPLGKRLFSVDDDGYVHDPDGDITTESDIHMAQMEDEKE